MLKEGGRRVSGTCENNWHCEFERSEEEMESERERECVCVREREKKKSVCERERLEMKFCATIFSIQTIYSLHEFEAWTRLKLRDSLFFTTHPLLQFFAFIKIS